MAFIFRDEIMSDCSTIFTHFLVFSEFSMRLFYYVYNQKKKIVFYGAACVL